MRRRERPRPDFPAHLAAYDPAAWVDRYHWTVARWEWWQAHPGLHDAVDPIRLLYERRQARRAAGK